MKKKFVIVIVFMLTISIFYTTNVEANSPSTVDNTLAPYMEIITSVADEYGIAPEFIEAVIWTESRGKANVTSSGGAKGLMQIIPRWHRNRMSKLGVTDIYDPEGNIRVGCDYLAELFEKYEDPYVVLMSYNEGESKSIIRRCEEGRFSSYSKNIVELSDKLQDLHYPAPEFIDEKEIEADSVTAVG